jgi:hypothetical protein
MRAENPIEKGIVATQDRAMPPNKRRLTNEVASLVRPFSTRPRQRPAPIRAPTCEVDRLWMLQLIQYFTDHWLRERIERKWKNVTEGKFMVIKRH